ncbi:hypothetical protein [Nocardia gamkensis]|uniref:hypothetical protein n=2 Tax=Nocardia TaxID=1817 RepID=UPI0007A43970|nr:hypothetical protein [Nocardia gamkensis]
MAMVTARALTCEHVNMSQQRDEQQKVNAAIRRALDEPGARTGQPQVGVRMDLALRSALNRLASRQGVRVQVMLETLAFGLLTDPPLTDWRKVRDELNATLAEEPDDPEAEATQE